MALHPLGLSPPLPPAPPHSALRTLHSAFLVTILFLPFGPSAHAQDSPRLPWEPAPLVSEPVLRPPSGPAEILERYNIGESQLDNFVSGADLSPGEVDVLAKILYHFPRLGLDNLLLWRQKGVGFDQLAADPREHRLQVFHVSGRVKRVEKRALLPEQAELYEFGHYYQVTLALEGSPYQASIAARCIPEAWPVGEAIDEPAQADVLFLKVGHSMADPPQLVFAAHRLGWFPNRPSQPHHIGPAQLALAGLGMDISLWDDVQKSKDQALTTSDREAFYQLLAALNRPESRQLGKQTADSLDLVPLLEKPTEHFGAIVPVEGVARRVMKVPVGDPDVQSRFGIDHYYEIDLFVSLGDASLRFGNDANGEKNPVYRNTFPATLIVRDLPPGLEAGENVHELVRATAVFFKIWAYRSSYTGRFGQLQPAPLFIAANARVVPLQPQANWVTGGLVMAAFAITIGVVGIMAWVYSRENRATRTSVPQGNDDKRPDFSGLGP